MLCVYRACRYHDCGKMVDRKAHAAHSPSIYKEHGGDAIGAYLMSRDMDIHVLKADDCWMFRQSAHWMLLYLIGLAAINANADAWGGRDSTNFKIKMKHFTQRGKSLFGDCRDEVRT